MTFFRMEMVRDKLEKMKKFWQVSRREGDDAPAVGHFVFTGSPGKFFRDKIFGQVSFLTTGGGSLLGTGKTTVARAIANILFSLGLLPSSKITETSALDLTGDYLGQTKTKVNKALKDSKGGVLFIDEAYNLGLGPYGVEACDTIVQGMTSEEFRDVVIVIAGYPADIDDMLNRNAGLKSRFTHFFEFPDWEPEDCAAFFKQRGASEGFEVGTCVVEEFKQGCVELKSLNGWGNGRDVKKIWDEAKAERANRVCDTPEIERSLQLSDLQLAMSSMVAARKPKVSRISSSWKSEGWGNFRTQDSQNDIPSSIKVDVSQNIDSGAKNTQTDPFEEQSDVPDFPDDDAEVCFVNEERPDTAPDLRDDGVSDEAWARLQETKERDRLQMEEIAQEQAALDEFIAEQHIAEEEARIKLEIDLRDMMQQKLERGEQERAIRLAEKAEARRRQLAELERRRRQEAQRNTREELRKKQAIQERLRKVGLCPMGYVWHRVGGGWQCHAGGHYVTDQELEHTFTYR